MTLVEVSRHLDLPRLMLLHLTALLLLLLLALLLQLLLRLLLLQQHDADDNAFHSS